MNFYGDDESRFIEWSGDNSDCERKDAAKKLARTLRNLNKYRPDEPITIVAHSHGGNVALLASEVTGTRIDNLVTLGTPIMKHYQPGNTIGTWTNVYSVDDRVQTLPIGARRIHNKAINVRLRGFGHSDLHTTAAWDMAFSSSIP